MKPQHFFALLLVAVAGALIVRRLTENAQASAPASPAPAPSPTCRSWKKCCISTRGKIRRWSTPLRPLEEERRHEEQLAQDAGVLRCVGSALTRLGGSYDCK